MSSPWGGLASIAAAPLRPLGAAAAAATTEMATTVPLSSLWSKGSVLIYGIRRPGCLLCRDNAASIWKREQEFKAAGVSLAAVVHEAVDREIAAFAPEFWGGPLYCDSDKALYKAFGEGKLRTAGMSGLLDFGVWRRILAARKRVGDGNTTGDSSVLGGVLLVTGGDKGAPRIAYLDVERTFGEFKGVDAYLEAAKKVGGGGSK
jgi:peroxiredoxin